MYKIFTVLALTFYLQYDLGCKKLATKFPAISDSIFLLRLTLAQWYQASLTKGGGGRKEGGQARLYFKTKWIWEGLSIRYT